MTNELPPALPPASHYSPPLSLDDAPAPSTRRKDMPWVAYIAIVAALMLLAWWRFATLVPNPKHGAAFLAGFAVVVLLIPAIASIISYFVGTRVRVTGVIALALVVTIPSGLTLLWEATHEAVPAPRLAWPAGWTPQPVEKVLAGAAGMSKAVFTSKNRNVATLIALAQKGISTMRLRDEYDLQIKASRALSAVKNTTIDVFPPVDVDWNGFHALEFDTVMHTPDGPVRQRTIRTNGAGGLGCTLGYTADLPVFESHLDAYESIKQQFVCRPTT